MKKLVMLTLLAASLAFTAIDASAQTKTRVRFAAGTHGTTVRGTVRGYAYRDYIVGASGGQTMKVDLNGTDDATVFSIFAPNSVDLDGATETNAFAGELPRNGDYVIRVMMMRVSARRKGSFSNYTLKITIK